MLTLSHLAVIVRSFCLLAFLLQAGFLFYNLLNPTHTEIHTEIKNLADLPFPAVFKICIKPAFNMEFLNRAGYDNTFYYFLGRSKYNSSLYGWAGHTQTEQVFNNITGKCCKFIHSKEMCFLNKLDGLGPLDNKPSTDYLCHLNFFLLLLVENRRIQAYTWHVTGDRWHVTHGTWHVTHDTWCGVNIISKCLLSRLESS